jgi:hypothetical protein
MSYTPKFDTKTSTSKFLTNSPAEADRESLPVTIAQPMVDAARGAFVIKCSDRDNSGRNRVRTCLYHRLPSEAAIKALEKKLQSAFDKGTPVTFVAAGGNSPDVWFYNVK